MTAKFHLPPPDCPPPPKEQRAAARLTVPPGAVDTHAHVIGTPPEYAFVAERTYTPPAASAERYIEMLDATGMTYGVLVQVSVHGTDNLLLLNTLRSHPKRLRGIAVMPLGLPESDYAEAKAAGVVGLRLNDLYGGGIDFSQLREYGALAREFGWHMQFLLDVRRLRSLASGIAKLPVNYVVDHMGHFPVGEVPLDGGDFQTVVSMVRDGGWVKLSGAYRLSDQDPPYADTIPYAQALIDASSERCVWGSDWPHVSHWKHMMSVGELLDTFALWCPDRRTQRAVLVDNPAKLYGFPRTLF